MTWQVHQEGPILDGDRVVGSMIPLPRTQDKIQRWRIEILWSGAGGDMIYETDTHSNALAYVLGVEAVFNRLMPRHSIFDEALAKLPKLRKL